ncbi:MAG: FdtA/QdtA family cupin domain-containing protein [Acidimicrobiales bacterium]|jgi:dTDP-4-dehydrorhamnose 3,5-epimerase-like enzyme
MSVAECHIVSLPKVADVRGNLTFIEGGNHIPFEIKRVYYLYDVPGGETRGGHAHKELQQLVIAAAGSFEVVVRDGQTEASFYLNRSYFGLYIPQMTWREIVNFSSASVCLVLASTHFSEDDYYREWDEYVAAIASSDDPS